MATLERAIEIAVEAHREQVDKVGAPYILHPLRVMLACTSDESRIVGVLHDVVEDTEWTFQRLEAERFDADVLDGLRAVTKRPNEEYLDFCRRAAAHPLGREVKRADIQDNMDITRLGPTLSEKDKDRLERYRQAWEIVR